jgi:hypothetical protein
MNRRLKGDGVRHHWALESALLRDESSSRGTG